MLKRSFLPFIALAVITVFLGCDESPQSNAIATGETADGSIAVLTPEAIQKIAKEQKVCAVTGEPLGSMGDPVPVLVADKKQNTERTVLLCCESCRQELLDHTDRYLAELDEKLESAP